MANLSIESQLKKIEKQLQSKIQDALAKEVFEKTRNVMQEHIQKDVYDAYTPYNAGGGNDYYHRTYELIADDTIEGKVKGNVLTVKNTRHEDKRDIVEVIETGKGYTWGYTRDLNEEIGAREFIAETKKDLRENGQHIEALKSGLKRQGLIIE